MLLGKRVVLGPKLWTTYIRWTKNSFQFSVCSLSFSFRTSPQLGLRPFSAGPSPAIGKTFEVVHTVTNEKLQITCSSYTQALTLCKDHWGIPDDCFLAFSCGKLLLHPFDLLSFHTAGQPVNLLLLSGEGTSGNILRNLLRHKGLEFNGNMKVIRDRIRRFVSANTNEDRKGSRTHIKPENLDAEITRLQLLLKELVHSKRFKSCLQASSNVSKKIYNRHTRGFTDSFIHFSPEQKSALEALGSSADSVSVTQALLFVQAFTEYTSLAAQNTDIQFDFNEDRFPQLSQPHLWYPLARTKVRRIIAHIGPTNSGKTHSAIEALKRAERAVYCGPS
jgi:hypothetical protein